MRHLGRNIRALVRNIPRIAMIPRMKVPPKNEAVSKSKLRTSLLFRFPATDSPVFGVSRATWAALAKRKGVSETEAIRRAMSDYAIKNREPSPEEAPLPTAAQRRYELALKGSDGLTGQQRLDQFNNFSPVTEGDRHAFMVTSPKKGRHR